MRLWPTCKTAGLEPIPMSCLSALAPLFVLSLPTAPFRSSSRGRCAGRESSVRAGARPMCFVTLQRLPFYGKGHRCRTSRPSFGTVPSRRRKFTPK